MRFLVKKIIGSELAQNRYFALGVAIQKGTPIFIVPLVVSLYGSSVYADYILLYSVAQVVAIVTGLCLSYAVIPFWYKYHDKEKYLGSLLSLMVITQTILSIAAFIILAQINFLKEHEINGFTVALMSIIYAVIYNVNIFGLNFIRAQSKQVGFFWTTLFGAFIQIVLIILFRKLSANTFVLFYSANIFAALIQVLTYFLISDNLPVQRFSGRRFLAFSRRMLTFSVSLSAYVIIALLSLVVDKWIVKAYFGKQIFAQYVVDYQFSFGIALLSYVVGMYNASRVCKLVHDENWHQVRANTIEHYWLSVFGSIALGAGGYVYAYATGVHLSLGFLILTFAFLLNNLYGINSGLLTAQKRSNALARIAGIAAAVFITLLFIAGYFETIFAVYVGQIIYQLILLTLSWTSIRSMMTRNPELQRI